MTGRPLLCGTWSLVSNTAVNERGATSLPVGENPRGRLVYQPDGHMAVMLGRSDRPARPDVDVMDQAADGFVAYAGTYTVDVDAGVVVHHVDVGSAPHLNGTPLARRFVLDDDQLTLTTVQPMNGRTMTLVWRRWNHDVGGHDAEPNRPGSLPDNRDVPGVARPC